MSDLIYRPDPVWSEHFGEGHDEWLFYCPGCRSEHRYIVKWGAKAKNYDGTPKTEPTWTFNGNMEKPTFRASLLCTWEIGEERKKHRCHLFLTDGRLEFCSDSTHHLSGQNVPLEPHPKKLGKTKHDS